MGPVSADVRAGPGGRTSSESSVADRREDALNAPRQLRVLSVDDHLAQAELIGLMLSPLGYVMHVTFAAETAISMLETCAYDLLITDVGPGNGMNGWELTAHVKEHYPQFHVFLISVRYRHANDDDTGARLRNPGRR